MSQIPETTRADPSGSRSAHHTLRWGIVAATGALFAASFVLLLGLNLHRELNHDEHQFIASAALIARAGLTPYADFPYFHTPLLSYLYALLFSTFDALLLSSRVVSVILGWLALVVVFGVAWRRFAVLAPWARWRAASLAALWLLALPVFAYTGGRAWNHDLPTLLLLLAVVAFNQAITRRRQTGWLLLCGALIGLAAATRLSFALAGIVVFGAAWLAPAAAPRQRVIHALAVAAGGLLATLVALAPALRDPAALWFGNVGYIQLNARYYAATAYGDAMTLAGKLRYFGDLLVAVPTNLLVFTALGVGVVAAARRAETQRVRRSGLGADPLSAAVAAGAAARDATRRARRDALTTAVFLPALPAGDPERRRGVCSVAGARPARRSPRLHPRRADDTACRRSPSTPPESPRSRRRAIGCRCAPTLTVG
jgi:4-amino-4-deoxy-L-arabinose transferase-like glycosyltransferase